MNKVRFWGLDLLKLHSFLIVVAWHYTSVMWANYGDFFMFRDTNIIWHWIELWNRTFINSGHTILMVSAFLSGMHGGKIGKIRFYVFLAIGIFAFPLIEARGPSEPIIEWDIYALIFVGFAFSGWIQKVSRKTLVVCAAAFFALTWIPFWKLTFPASWPEFIQQFLIGDCEMASGQWPLLPWIFFLWFFFILGRLYKLEKGEKYLPFSWKTVGLWAIAFLSALPWMGRFYTYVPNQDTHCLLLRTEPIEFYAQFIPILACFHIGLMDRPNEWLKKNMSWIASLEVTRSFWIVYFLQYMVINIMERAFGMYLRMDAWTCLIGLAVIWPLCEMLSAGLRAAYRKFSPKSST